MSGQYKAWWLFMPLKKEKDEIHFVELILLSVIMVGWSFNQDEASSKMTARRWKYWWLFLCNTNMQLRKLHCLIGVYNCSSSINDLFHINLLRLTVNVSAQIRSLLKKNIIHKFTLKLFFFINHCGFIYYFIGILDFMRIWRLFFFLKLMLYRNN